MYFKLNYIRIKYCLIRLGFAGPGNLCLYTRKEKVCKFVIFFKDMYLECVYIDTL